MPDLGPTFIGCSKVNLIHVCLELEEPAKPLLLSLEYIQAESSGTPAVRELKIGAIRTAQFASKKVNKMKNALSSEIESALANGYQLLSRIQSQQRSHVK